MTSSPIPAKSSSTRSLLFTTFVGWKMSKDKVRDEFTNGGTVNTRLFDAVYFLMRYVAPVGILVVFATNLLM